MVLVYNTFLSYNSADRPLVSFIAVALRDAAGIEVFYDEWSLVPGDAWQEELEKALWASESCAIFIGANGFGPWHKEEMRSALERRVGDQSFRVIPVLLPSFSVTAVPTMPLFLRRYSWVDFRKGLDSQKEFERLVEGILGHRSRARRIADLIRRRLEDANSNALSMVEEHSKVDEFEFYGSTLTNSLFGVALIVLVFGLLGWPVTGEVLLLVVAASFIAGLPFWFSFSERRFREAREKYAQRFNNLYGSWRFKINPEQIFKLEAIYCPACSSRSICSRLDGRSTHTMRNALLRSAVNTGVFGGSIFIMGGPSSDRLSFLPIFLFIITLFVVREVWGWRRIRFFCLVRGHEFSSFDGALPRLVIKLLESFTRD